MCIDGTAICESHQVQTGHVKRAAGQLHVIASPETPARVHTGSV